MVERSSRASRGRPILSGAGAARGEAEPAALHRCAAIAASLPLPVPAPRSVQPPGTPAAPLRQRPRVISAIASTSPVDPPPRAAQTEPATTSAAADPNARTRGPGATAPKYRFDEPSNGSHPPGTRVSLRATSGSVRGRAMMAPASPTASRPEQRSDGRFARLLRVVDGREPNPARRRSAAQA